MDRKPRYRPEQRNNIHGMDASARTIQRGRKMKQSELENYLGQHVEITLFDDFAYRGILRKTEEKIERYVKRFYYFCEGEQDNIIFRCSHVKKIKQLQKG